MTYTCNQCAGLIIHWEVFEGISRRDIRRIIDEAMQRSGVTFSMLLEWFYELP